MGLASYLGGATIFLVASCFGDRAKLSCKGPLDSKASCELSSAISDLVTQITCLCYDALEHNSLGTYL